MLPQLEQAYNPQVRHALVRLADMQQCDSNLLDTLAEDALPRCLEEGVINRQAFDVLNAEREERNMSVLMNPRNATSGALRDESAT